MGFLPFIPQPIIEIETVYTCLLKFKKTASDLQQKVLPVFCDEGVYHLVIKIFLDKPHLFDNLCFMLGSFHMAKAALKCAGKILKGSGVEVAMIETGIYGPKTVEVGLSGGHYYKRFLG